MNLKPIFVAGAVAFAASTAGAAVISVTDGGGDFEVAPSFSDPYTLDFDAVDTGGTFDTTSFRFVFNGSGTGSETFDFLTVGPAVLTIGNLVESADFSTATITFDDGVVAATVIDLKTDPDTTFRIDLASPFTLTTNFVNDPDGGEQGVGSYDFTVRATPVPVPAGILLMGTALAGFGAMRRKAKKKAA